ncbi:virulence factor MviN, partial [Streptococcus pneumoniae]
DIVIYLPFLNNTGFIVMLSAIYYISLLGFTKNSIFYEF